MEALMKTLVLIPAFGCDTRLYDQQIKALKGHWTTQVIVPTKDRYEGMVEEVLAEAPDEFAILGTSMGGRLALELTLAAPERVMGLCVIGAAAGATADPAAGLKRSARIRGGERDKVIAEMGEMIAHLPGPRGAATRDAFLTMGKAMEMDLLARQSDALAHRVDRWEEVAEIDCPTLCLWGVHDQFSPAADGLRLAEAVQEGSYVELPECGHFPTLEYPDESNDAILNWLDEVE
jgi:pimeloyl-ACP methyl ester carboxylesterase